MNQSNFAAGRRMLTCLCMYTLTSLLFYQPLFAGSVKNSIPAPDYQNKRPPADVRVSGTTKDRLGTPMSGVTVQVVGRPDIVTTTNAKGRFSITVPEKSSLQFSYVGYKNQVIAVNMLEMDITMEAAQGSLQEVVVVGFGRQRKISVIGAQSTINPEELKLPVANINTLLAGRIAGVIGVQRSGQPGQNSSDIWIRGITSFGGGSSAPLILVDGVERPISNIDPEDIASFTILKDAAGTAVYGVRGANGVILITTKIGKQGKPQVRFDYSEGLVTFVKLPQMADAKTYMEAANESFTTRGQTAKYSPDYIQKTLSGADPELYPNVDWFNALYRKFGMLRRANVNVSGGSDFLRYYGSVSYYDETGLLKTGSLQKYNSDLRFKRFNVTSNVNMNITKTTKLDLGIRGWFTNSNRPALSTEDIFGSAMSTPPTEYPLEYKGGFVPGKNPNGGYRNPWADLTRRGYATDFQNSIASNLRLTQDLVSLLKGLSVTTMFAFDAFNTMTISRSKREDTFFPDPNQPRNADGSLNLKRTYVGSGNYLNYNRSNGGNRRFYSESSLNYNNTFGKHRVGGLVLFYTDDYQNQFAGDFTSSIPERYLGLASRITYSYDDRYFIEGNLGYNGSETFAPDKRYGTFPAFGLGWIPSNEKFFAPVKKVITYLKFRYSDGLTGIGRIGGRRFAYLTLMSDNVSGYRFDRNYGEMRGINITDYGSVVTWAQSRKQDLGIEVKTLQDHLSVIVDLFKEKRTGIFLQRQSLPVFMGLSNTPWGNLGVVENKGIDATLEYNGRIGNVNLSLRGNITHNNDVILENDQPNPKYPWMNQRGHNILARWGYMADGLFGSQDEINKSAVPGDKSQVLPGDIKYKDLNGDGLINSYDKVVIGRGDVPNWVFGFGFNVEYKRFNLGALFAGQAGADIMLSGDGIYPFANGAGITNVYANITNRWQDGQNNSNVFYPRLANGEDRNRNNTQPSSWWVRNTDFVRLKTLELSYNLPKSWYNGIFRNASVYLQAINPITFSKFKLWDVESTVNAGNGGRYPNVKSYSLGVTVDF
ncbi:TonB-linked outer membrane protein, SusC/RagA family [Hydrobacter penzbergensis]|uniref:TonB-linked outer membrane protein, SusC/RagA family n=1 Tax=Hydrobacter penzbergensis TaxID=1235997 RepID=A0A8X8IFV5_9BACT|nr:TonB-dependent receptor [Hydrobacter penzbergensis]SDX09893.1 TonB-linked outer membrane protein, SusC/RagA family [Hydrobacter penzbergensis]